MFITRRNIVSSVVCLSSLLVCGQLYPVRDEPDHVYGNYDSIGMTKRDPSNLKDSLLSALLMSEMPKADTSNQRKKAVDSTFIRFGRSSASSGKFSPSVYDDSSSMVSQDLDYGASPKSGYMDSSIPSTEPNAVVVPSRFANKDEGCLVRSKSDLYLVLMGKSCVRVSPKVKRENVNDTFIRFGKRDVQSTFARIEGSDKDIKYGR